MRRPRRSYPQHSVPLLTCLDRRDPIGRTLPRLSPHYARLIEHLRHGARVLLDIEQRRALIYSFRRGIEELGQITLRALSELVKAGLLVPTAREGRLVHYGYASA